MGDLIFLPAFILLIAAGLLAVLPAYARLPIIILAPVMALASIFGMDENLRLETGFLSYQVVLIENSGLRSLFATSFTLVLLAGLLYVINSARKVELVAAMAYGGAAVGLAFAGDLLVLFLFWEFMLIFSAILVFSAGTEAARKAGIHYVILQLLGGLLLKVGSEAVSLQTGSVELRVLSLNNYGAWLILFAVMLNAAAVPLSVWFTRVVSSASPEASIFLAVFTTKTAILISALLFPGATVLFLFGALMIVYGAVYGLREDNIRKLLAYAVVSQVGFMLCAVGVGTAETMTALGLFAVVHIFAVTLLFMGAHTVIRQTGSESITELGRLRSLLPLTSLTMALGGLAMLVLPATSGLLVATANSAAEAMSYFLVPAAALTVFHVGYKLWWRLFYFNAGQPQDAREVGLLHRVLMLYVALPVVVLSVMPQLLVEPFFVRGAESLLQIEQLAYLVGVLFIAAIIIWGQQDRMSRPRSIEHDFDHVYRVWLLAVWRGFERLLGRSVDQGVAWLNGPLRRIPESWLNYHGPQGPLARTWATGSMLLWVTLILAVLLIGARLMF